MDTFIFDFDGTLADSKQCSLLATKSAFQAMGLTLPAQEVIEFYMGIPIETSFKEMANRELTNDEFEQLLVVFRQAYKEFENDSLMLFPQIKEVLKILTQNDVDCFVVSSKKTDVLFRNLTSLDITGFFKDWIGSDQVKLYKPHPDGVLSIVERFDLDVSTCIVIGDAIFDIQMGKAAGCKTCAVTWGSHTKEQLLQEEPDYCIDEVSMLVNLLEKKL
ncbi:phosphatase [Siminovitchia terrae]|uniref:Phosphatase n=1 Tax=Siminovitchia terrae TaxID=1914933 RepID=A0ABQ4L1M5_SIMTE|nr:HAD family hydrolase [Siminovitchia terrae]GIN97462.1 phosphatase [Siminovitchia terrae]